MLVKLYKPGDAKTAALVILAAMVLWADSFILSNFELPDTDRGGVLYRLLLLLLQPIPLLNVFVGFTLLISQVFIINSISFNYNFLGKSSWLPGFFYLVIMSSHPGYLFLTSSIAANFFLLLAIERIFRVFEMKDPVGEIFLTGLLISLAGLFQFSSFVFVGWFLVILIVFFLPSARAIAAAITGATTPIMILAAWYFLDFRLEQESTQFISRFLPGFFFEKQISQFEYLLMAALAILSVMALVKLYSGKLAELPLRVRNRVKVLIYFFFSFMVALLFFQDEFEASHSLASIPLSVFLAMYFHASKRTWIAELLVFLLLGLIIFGKIIHIA